MAAATLTADAKKKDTHPRDPAREVVETIVFVVVLVLLLKLFVTEAFVIPTGSMAETLYGDQKVVTCSKCGHEFPVNSHGEVEADENGVLKHLVGYTCPNCRFSGTLDPAGPPTTRSGDRVLVLKPLYHLARPSRGDVVVFKFPRHPQKLHTAQNYIKRAMGFGGETVAVWRGELFVTRALEHAVPPDVPDDDLWMSAYQHVNDPRAVELFEASRKAGFPDKPIGELPPDQAVHFRGLLDGDPKWAGRTGFVIVRKPDDHALACRRLVWDNDQQPKELAGKVPPRWQPEAAFTWQPDGNQQPREFTHAGDQLDWLRYRHLITVLAPVPERDDNDKPKYNADGTPRYVTETDATGRPVIDATTGQPKVRTQARPWQWDDTLPPVPWRVDNFLGYNAGREVIRPGGAVAGPRSDYTDRWVGDLYVECEADVRAAGAEVALELSKGPHRFRATFAGGKVTLTRTGPGAWGPVTADCKVNGTGKYKLRFANVDSRLRVWVNDKAIGFGAAADYDPGEAAHFDPEDAGHEGWTTENDVNAPAGIGAKGAVAVRGIKVYRDLYYTQGHRGEYVYYVQPGHYLCLGDNSAASSDSREWGSVPERLMLGKAVFVFWPFSTYAAYNRIGFIK